MPERGTQSPPQSRPVLRTEPERIERCGHWDWPAVVLTAMLLVIGMVTLFSASYAVSYDTQDGNPFFFIKKQGTFALGGIALAYVLSKVPYQKLHYVAIPGLIFAILLLATIKVPGISSLWINRNGAIRWMKIPGIGTFQPSEVVKTAIILSFSSIAAMLGKKKMHTLKWGILPFMVILAIIAVEMKWEKHLSGALIIVALGMCILFLAGANLFWFFLGGVGVAAGAVGYIATHSYVQERFKYWLDPFLDPLDSGYQAVQSHIAIGSGGFWGLGLGQSVQKHLYLPEPPNDFIFSVYCEEMGFVGAVLLILVFCLLIWRGFYIARHASDRFGTLLAAGITTKIAMQTFLNFAVVSGVLPITGASLPFFSFGGTALLLQLAEVGILLSISRSMPAKCEG